jgi:hypothetical protein
MVIWSVIHGIDIQDPINTKVYSYHKNIFNLHLQLLLLAYHFMRDI